MLRKIGRFFYYSLFFITPLLVLSSTSELFEFNKMNYIYLSSLTIAFLVGLSWIRSNTFPVKKNALTYPLLGFGAVLLLSLLFSIDKHTSFIGYYGRFNVGLLSYIAYANLFFCLPFFFKKKDLPKILLTSVITSVVVMIWGLFGTMGRDLSCLVFTGQFNNSCWTDQFRPAERMFSTLGQPNWLGAYLAIHFFIGLYFTLRQYLSRWYLGYSYLLLTFSCILLTRSRSALLSVAIGSLIFGLALLFTKQFDVVKKQGRKLLIFGVLMIIAVAGLKTGIAKIDGVLNLASKPSASNNSATARYVSSEVTESLDIRKIVWKGAVDLGKQYPILGTGPETFAYSYYFTRPQEHNMTSEWDYVYNKAHNEYLNYLATTGFLGLGVYLLVIGIVLWQFKKHLQNVHENRDERLLQAALLGSYSTILVTNFFGFSTTTINLFFFLIPAFFFLRDQEQSNDAVTKYNSGRKVKIALISVGYLFGLVWLVIFFLADTQYARGIVYEASGDYIKAYEYVGTAANLRSEPVYLDKLSNLGANVALVAAYQDKQDLVQKLMTNSRLHNLRALQASPKNIQYWKTSAKNSLLYYQITLDKKYLSDGIEAVQTAMALAPTEPKLPYTEAVLYSVLADDSTEPKEKEYYVNQAVLSAKKAIQLKPNYDSAQEFLTNLTKL